GGGEALRAHGHAIHRGEPPGRRQQPRRRDRGQGAAGRVHPAADFGELHGQPQRLQAHLRSDQRHHADHPGLRRALRGGDPSVGAGQQPEGVRRVREEAAGEAGLRLLGQRQHHARRQRVLSRCRQDQGPAHSVQGHRAGGGGHHRRPGAARVRRRAGDAAAREGRAPARARRDDRQAHRGRPRLADGRRVRLSRLRGDQLARPGGAEGPAARHRRALEPGNRRGGEGRRDEEEPGRRWPRAGGRLAGALRPDSEERDGALGQGRPAGRHKGGLTMLRKLLVLALWLPAWALAQSYPLSYPSKPVRIVLPFGPGGVADITTRTIAPKMSEGLGQQVVVENMPGAGGIRAAETVARAEPDGHTLLLLTNGNAVSQALFKSLPYDPVNDFAMISTVGYFSMVIVTGANSKYKTLQDVIAAAKQNPGKLNIGTISPGGTQHLAGELFRSSAGMDALVVPHKTTGEVVIGVRNGNLDVGVDFIAPLISGIKSGDLRALAVTAGKRQPQLPDVPTAQEAGVK